MADQTTMSRNNGAHEHASPLTVVGNIADFGNDVATLAELQAKLTMLDTKEAISKATMPLVVLAVGAVIGLASFPVLLIGLADVISANSNLSVGVSRLIVGAAALLIAGAAGFFGLKGSMGSLTSFRRSREELVRNISWIRTVLVHSGRTVGRRQF